MLNKQFKFLILSVLFTLNVLGSGTYIKGPALIEGFTTITSAAGTTTLTVASETKQIVTGATTQTIVMPDATTLPLGRKFLIINKSSGNVTVNDGSGGLLVTVAGGTQAEVHLRTKAIAAGVWDVLESSAGGGGGTWGSITGTLSDQTDLQTALDAKADENNPGFAGTIGTTITASRLLVTDGSSNLAASTTTATEAGYLSGVTGGIQTQLDAKQLRSTLTTKGDLYVATASATTARQGVGSDGQILAADSTKTNGIKWIDPVNADNLIFDGDAEAGITNFVEGSYSAATRPSGTFTASSGAGTFQISTSSSSPLFGTNSFLLTKSSGASRQGRAIERTINLDSGYQTKMLKTRIDYTIVSGTFVAGSNGSSPTDSSLIWYVGQYNGSTWTYHEPSTFKMFSNSTTNKDWVEGEFQVNADTTQLKLIGFISESANSAWVVKAEVGFRLSAYLAGTPISDWQEYTPTGSWVTNTTYTGKWRRVGDTLESQINLVLAGAPTAADLTVNFLPSGLTVDSAKMAAFSFGSIGDANIIDSGSRVYIANPAYNGGSSVYIVHTESGNGGVVNATNPTTFASADNVRMNIRVPITGWSSSVQVSDGYDGRLIAAHAHKNGTDQTGVNPNSSYVKITFPSVASSGGGFDKTSSFDTTNSKFTAPSAGLYRITAYATVESTNVLNNDYGLAVYKNGSISKVLVEKTQAATTILSVGGSVTLELLSNDYLELYFYGLGNNSASTLTISGGASSTYFIVEKLQSPTTISATEVVAASYQMATAQTLTSAATIKFDTKIIDTHNAYNTTTGVFTAPVSGLYEVSAQLFSVTATGEWTPQIRKQSSAVARTSPSPVFNTGTTINNNQSMARFSGYLVELTAGQTLDIYNSLAIGTGTIYNSAIDNWLTIKRIK